MSHEMASAFTAGCCVQPFAIFCLQVGKKALRPQELHSVLDSLDRHFRYNDEARLSEAWSATFYLLVDIVLQSNRIAEIHIIATTIFQLDLSLEQSFERDFTGGSCIESFRQYDP